MIVMCRTSDSGVLITDYEVLQLLRDKEKNIEKGKYSEKDTKKRLKPVEQEVRNLICIIIISFFIFSSTRCSSRFTNTFKPDQRQSRIARSLVSLLPCWKAMIWCSLRDSRLSTFTQPLRLNFTWYECVQFVGWVFLRNWRWSVDWSLLFSLWHPHSVGNPSTSRCHSTQARERFHPSTASASFLICWKQQRWGLESCC